MVRDFIKKNFAWIITFWFFAVSLVVLVGALAICLYRYKLGTELSDSPADWSVFGAYVGGVLGPLVSFVTLFAVLKTVYLQRELLDSQRREMERMGDLQNDTFIAQKEQAASLAADAVRARVAEYQSTILQLIDQQLSIQQRVVDLMDVEEQKIASNKNLTWDVRNRAEDSIARRRQKALRLVDELSKFSMQVAVAEYDSTSNLREFVSVKLGVILPWLADVPLSKN